MRTLNLVDLFCGAGGAAMGLHQGLDDLGIPHEIYGVDIVPQKHYPFHFILGDALHPPFDLRTFDFVWASPPCQKYSTMQNIHKNRHLHPDLVEPTRRMLDCIGIPYVIENVEGAPLKSHILLCGTMFGLNVGKHRYFETTNIPLRLMPPCDHRNLYDPYHGGDMSINERAKYSEAIGVTWFMTRPEVRNAIPPAYSRYIIKQIFGNQ